jgi:hypothetical protein
MGALAPDEDVLVGSTADDLPHPQPASPAVGLNSFSSAGHWSIMKQHHVFSASSTFPLSEGIGILTRVPDHVSTHIALQIYNSITNSLINSVQSS